MDESRIAALGLAMCPDLERGTLHKLLDGFGRALTVWKADSGAWQTVVQMRPETIIKLTRWRAQFNYDAALATLHERQMWLIYRDEEGYPEELIALRHPPLVIFGLGNKALLNSEKCKVSVVGTRRASGYGLESAAWIGETLSQAGCVVVSGLALGIDGAAQKGALQGSGGTIAVLAGGADVCYPVDHQGLYGNVIRLGAVISEYPPGLPVAKHRFLERNRLIAALGAALVVVQAGEKSGALKTVDEALEIGKDVYAVPGPITSVHCRGSNRLLQQGAQTLIDPSDLLADLGLEWMQKPEQTKVPQRWQLLYENLMEPASAGSLAEVLNLPVANIYAALLELELAGLVERKSGGFYQRISHFQSR